MAGGLQSHQGQLGGQRRALGAAFLELRAEPSSLGPLTLSPGWLTGASNLLHFCLLPCFASGTFRNLWLDLDSALSNPFCLIPFCLFGLCQVNLDP